MSILKKNKGITLIALVISIIVLLILSGVTINAISGSESAPAKANEAGQKNDIGAAKDDISLTVVNAKMQGMETAYVENGVSKSEASTTVGQTVINSVLEKNGTNIGKATINVEQTEENGVKGNASISIYTTDFVLDGTITLNDGVLTWEDIEPNIPRITGVPETLSLDTNSTYTINAKLKGTTGSISWSSNKTSIASVSSGVITTATSITNPTEQVTITASANGCESKTCVVTVNKVMTAKDILIINPSATKAEEKSPYVIYKAGKNIDDTTNGETNEILCRVLYNDDTHGLQLISVNPVTDVILGANDPNYVTTSSTNVEEAQNSYNHAIINLNNKAEEYLNNDGIAVDARCVGSLSTISSITKKFDKKDNPDDLVTNIDNPTDEEKNTYMFTGSYAYLNSYNGKYFNTDSNYTEDENRLKASGGIDAYKISKNADGSIVSSGDYYWLASRKVDSRETITYFDVHHVVYDGYGKTSYDLWNTFPNGKLYTFASERKFGIRPVFSLDTNVKLTGTGENLGSESNPYGLTK